MALRTSHTYVYCACRFLSLVIASVASMAKIALSVLYSFTAGFGRFFTTSLLDLVGSLQLHCWFWSVHYNFIAGFGQFFTTSLLVLVGSLQLHCWFWSVLYNFTAGFGRFFTTSLLVLAGLQVQNSCRLSFGLQLSFGPFSCIESRL